MTMCNKKFLKTSLDYAKLFQNVKNSASFVYSIVFESSAGPQFLAASHAHATALELFSCCEHVNLCFFWFNLFTRLCFASFSAMIRILFCAYAGEVMFFLSLKVVHVLCMYLAEIPISSHVFPVSEAEPSDNNNTKKHLSPSQTSDRQSPESSGQPSRIHNAAKDSMKAKSPPVKSASPNTQSPRTEAEQDVLSRQLDQIDLVNFAPSRRSLASNSSHESSSRSATPKEITGVKGSSSAASSSPEISQPAFPCTAVQVLIDSAKALGVNSSVENRLSVVTSSNGSQVAVISSQGSSPGSGADQRDHDSGKLTGMEEGVGRGRRLLAMLKGFRESVEVGAAASSPSPRLTRAASRSSDESCAVLQKSKERGAVNLEQMPKQAVLSAGLDEVFDSSPESMTQQHLKYGEQVDAGKITSAKLSNYQIYPEVPVNTTLASNVGTSEQAVADTLVRVHVSLAETKTNSPIQSSTSAFLSPSENHSVYSPSDHTIPVAQPPSEQIRHDCTPSPQPHEQSLGSDQSLSSSKMLTKRLPKIASRSGSGSSSRTTTPVPPFIQKPVPSQLSYSSFSDYSPSPSPEIHHNPVTNDTAMTANHRYFYDLLSEKQIVVYDFSFFHFLCPVPL